MWVRTNCVVGSTKELGFSGAVTVTPLTVFVVPAFAIGDGAT